MKKVADDLVTAGKKVLNTVSETAKKVGNAITNTVNKVVHVITHPAETIEKASKVVQETKEKVVSESKKIVKSVSNKIQNLGETITEAKTYVAKKAAEVHEKVKKTLCTTTNRIKEQLGKVDWASVGKIVAGGAIIAGLGVATVLTGRVVGAVAAGALAGAAVNGGIGAVVGGVTSAASGGSFLEGAANGFLGGTLTGAITGALTSGLGFVGGILKNPLTQNVMESAVDTVTETASTIVQGGEVSALDVLGNFAFGAVTGLDVPGGSKVDDILGAVNTTQTKKAVENFEEGVEELAKNKQVKETLEEIGETSGKATSRPTWRQSEIDAAADFPDYKDQISFINGKEVPYGTKGSVRPDYYKDGFSVDIKNYNVESTSGRSNLARNIEKQYYQRIQNLPEGTNQSVMIDIRGQNVSDEVLNVLYDDIMKRTNNGVEILFKID